MLAAPNAMRRLRIFLACFAFTLSAQDLSYPLKKEAVRFAVIGDMGTGQKGQFDIAHQMERYRNGGAFEFVLTLGDNIYGGSSPADFRRKFEEPYKVLLDGGVKFRASLGNHDSPNERYYKPFNMGEKRYYNFREGNVEFFALDSNYMDPEQLNWLTDALSKSKAEWKICYMHHPLYSDGKFHGSDVDLRSRLEPVLRTGGVNVVLSGHEHFYERIKPQNGIQYFVLGNSGELRPHDIRSSPPLMVKGFDTGHSFMVAEIDGPKFYFDIIDDNGRTVDSGVITSQPVSTSQK
jgi:hypothetical protein